MSAADLAGRPDFALGEAVVRPSTRVISGPGGEISVEPRVMQVLLVLREADGAVVTRDTLERRCWGGVFVSDDSINRAIAALRRVGRSVAANSFVVETIPRTGYRLVAQPATAPDVDVAPAPRISRRQALAGVISTAAIGGSLLLWRQSRADPATARIDALVAQGRDAWRLGLPDAEAQGIGFLREAAAIGPGRADVWGLLALLLRNVVEYGGPDQTAAALGACQQAARRALALDPRQGDALAALAWLPPVFGDWLGARRRFVAARDAAPDNEAAAANMSYLEMSTGRAAASLAIVEALLRREPLTAVHQHKQVYQLWSMGRLGEMDRAADRAMELWPKHPAIWSARLMTLAVTERPAAALTMLDEAKDLPPPYRALLTTTFNALRTRDPATVEAAVAANVAATAKTPAAAIGAVVYLGALGAVGPGLDVAEGYLARRGPAVGTLRPGIAQPAINDQHRRKTMMLWVPATAPLRAHPRFAALVEEIGLGDYWRRSGLGPDYLGGRPSAA